MGSPLTRHERLVFPGSDETTLVALVDLSAATSPMLRLIRDLQKSPEIDLWLCTFSDGDDFDRCWSALADIDNSEGTEGIRKELARLIPLDDVRLVAVTTTDQSGSAQIQIQAPPAVHFGKTERNEFLEWKRILREAGADDVTTKLDESLLYADVWFGTGEKAQEQVVGWDDMYDDSRRRSHLSTLPTMITVRRHGGDMTSELLTALTHVVVAASDPFRDEPRPPIPTVDEYRSILKLFGWTPDLSPEVRSQLERSATWAKIEEAKALNLI